MVGGCSNHLMVIPTKNTPQRKNIRKQSRGTLICHENLPGAAFFCPH
jgi:hypothetical protein